MYSFPDVTKLIEHVQEVCNNDSCLNNMSVTGEISDFKQYPNGHCYFTLKDSKCKISCVMFASYASRLTFRPTVGLKVFVTCKANIYPEQGKFQLYVYTMSDQGQGSLREQYLALFNKLNKEGLFSIEAKKRIPVMPRKIGVISSREGAVIHDIVVNLYKRNPYFDLTLYHASTQGSKAPPEIIAGLDYFEYEADFKVDVIIIARGGGSFEELFCFNDEALARRIHACNIPIISSLGHEIDFTFCDYTADCRVSTPTAAAEVVLPNYNDKQYQLSSLQINLSNAIYGYLKSQKNRLNALANHRALSGPEYQVKNEQSRVNDLKNKLDFTMNNILNNESYRLKSIIDRIDLTSPLKVLSRGYSITYDDQGRVINSGKSVKTDDKIVIQLSDSKVEAKITNVIIEGE